MRLIFILLVCLPLTSHSQIHESFNDDEINTNPTWNGDVSNFIVNANTELQLSMTDEGDSYLSTPSTSIEEATSQLKVRMAFNPSSSNYARVYLASDKEQLTDADNAIFIEIGSSNDNICLYKIENGTKQQMIEGPFDQLNTSVVDVMIKITHNANDWSLQADFGNGWEKLGTSNFEFNYPSAYFGLYCKYTKTRADKFFFDDIIVDGLPYTDTNPPTLTHFNLLNGSQIMLTFNEAIDESSIQPSDFILANSKQHPTIINYDNTSHQILLNFDPIIGDTDDDQLLISNFADIDGNVIESTSFSFSYYRIKIRTIKLLDLETLFLSFSKPVSKEKLLEASITIDNVPILINRISTENEHDYIIELGDSLLNKQSYTLKISQLYDSIEDLAPESSTQIMYFMANRFDVVFNEWMADPTPSMGLPEVEYIEIFNNTDYDISLRDWCLMINDKAVELPDSTISTKAYACLVARSQMSYWPNNKNTIFVDAMPALNNSGFDMVLLNKQMHIIDACKYLPTNIPGEGFKKDGGWSVERIDATNLSGTNSNYNWCMDLNGGTPTSTNSVMAINTDDSSPFITHTQLLNTKTLQLTFSETMLFTNIDMDLTPMSEINEITYDTTFLNYLNIEFNETLQTNEIHNIEQLSMKDLAGNQLIMDKAIPFGIPDTLVHGDIIINEVLFNPYPDAADFVEIYNMSDKIIDVSDIYFAAIKNNSIDKLHQASTTNHLFLPQSYKVITTDKESLLTNYKCNNPDAIIETPSLPSYPDDEGLVAIANQKGIMLDKFDYSEKMHFELLKNKEGISLERLSFDHPTNEANNWHSAASTAGFATPAYANSQNLSETKATKDFVSISPEVFTPNGDGIDDQLYIHFNSKEAGAMVTIRIFNSKGHEVRYLVNNQSLADTGYFMWNGLSEEHTTLAPGIYVTYIQCVYPSGKTMEEKVSCVISIGNNN
ncbi:lamin tail domain-containing protein [Carboxylicivirga marina]|uniref:Lamin tail domain-containing protein n=1 Tax=Carboxylicivirga marina TaxID=2800988 RepID=A0ABS1HI34_9BACT|nr:gliding motility-associated C-terminal domain-containing protein [Carboxylicivirga marina]MBK3517345.1 lamin tail domain-containing protein [Carboxylicivirga marina]